MGIMLMLLDIYTQIKDPTPGDVTARKSSWQGWIYVHLIQVDYTITRSSDHSSLMVSIGTNIEKQGKGTFRAPPGIEKEEAYQALIKEGIQLSHIRCKKFRKA